MITTKDIEGLIGNGTVVGQSGDKIGKVAQVYLDDESGEPEWVTANTGLFGSGESFVPLGHASVAGDEVTVPYDKAKVKDAPRVDQDGDGHLSPEQEAELYAYYGMSDTQTETVAEQARGAVGRDTSGPSTDEAMTRSEEQLKVGTEKVAAGKARLRKFIVTENVTTTVPVTREEVRVVTEPITEENRDAAMTGGELTSEEHEVTLTEERVVVTKEAVPVERVRLDKETVTEQQQVTEEVRKEQIETDTSDVNTGQPKRT